MKEISQNVLLKHHWTCQLPTTICQQDFAPAALVLSHRFRPAASWDIDTLNARWNTICDHQRPQAFAFLLAPVPGMYINLFLCESQMKLECAELSGAENLMMCILIHFHTATIPIAMPPEPPAIPHLALRFLHQRRYHDLPERNGRAFCSWDCYQVLPAIQKKLEKS